MTHPPDEQPAGTYLVLRDEALAAFDALGGATARGSVADLLREIITLGRDARVFVPRRPLRQYATIAELEAAIAAGEADALMLTGVPTARAGLTPTQRVLFAGESAEQALEDDPVAKRLGIVPCCDLHGVTCEPPSELCCQHCTERNHPDHPNVDCVLVQHEAAERYGLMLEIIEAAGDNGIAAGAIMSAMAARGRVWTRRSSLFQALKQAMDARLIVQPLERGRYHWVPQPAAGGDQ